MKSFTILFKSFFLFFLFLTCNAVSDTLNKIEIFGNDRISDETIKLFIQVDIKDEINDVKLNDILKDLYETDFFKDISVKFENQILFINVIENSIIENIFYNGIKSNKILEIIKQESSIKERSSYNENKDGLLYFKKILKEQNFFNLLFSFIIINIINI